MRIARAVSHLGSLLLLLGLPAVVAADASDATKTVGGITAYIGIVPAEMVRGHPAQHTEGSMHGGVPRGASQYHVMVALFDSQTGQRISNAEIWARVDELGLGGEERKLESMTVANELTYGNFYRMTGTGPFRITLKIRKPDTSRTVEMQFEHKHRWTCDSRCGAP